ncbi:putative CDP-alcohol phosphatidyltransferase class-I family protein [Smittium culicis]|uniref:Putative CDP-alcohol phosphatidyltransferase class-I family protein n=1 Tax=Smittium culicis TaxID=133412 RepID=A0A1R1Y3F6_9FUNG|nr:putative CDP-alcohol phosphatidyltransferase class-I family protein [Smittium culicis]
MFAINLKKSFNFKNIAPISRIQVSKYSKILENRPAIVFDIDGVLGDTVLEKGVKALKYLNGENPLNIKFPYIFMTNSGGLTEEQKANEITQKMGVQVNPNQIVLSHSPMRQLVNKYRNDNVLVIGGVNDRCAEIAKDYGFLNAISPSKIHKSQPNLWIFSKTDKSVKENVDILSKKFSAIFMFHDSYDYGRDLQISMDILRSKDAILNNKYCESKTQSVPVYFSNQDYLFSNESVNPRFAQGAFHESLKALWKKSTNSELKYNVFGKPHKVQYDYAEQLLKSLSDSASSINNKNQSNIYAIGDNPYSDIAGANSYGWNSVLVCTGVYQGSPGVNHSIHKASNVTSDVYEAVKWIVESNL